MCSKVRKHFAQMVESFKDAGVVDGRSVEQDAEDEEDKAGDSKTSIQMNFRFCFVFIICIT